MNSFENVRMQIGLQSLGSNNCIVCSAEEATREHVIPKWLQKRFGLASQKFLRPSGTKTIYGRMTVPLCRNCNSVIFGDLEKKISKDADCSFEESMQNSKFLELWLTKVYYGLQLFEYLNPVYQVDLDSKENLRSEDLHSVHLLHQTLRTLLKKDTVIFPDGRLASVWIFDCDPDWTESEFAFASSTGQNILALRVHSKVIFSVLGDWGEYERAGALERLPAFMNPVNFLAGFVMLKYFVAKNQVSYSFGLVGSEEGSDLELVPLRISAEQMDLQLGRDFENFFLAEMETLTS